MSAPANIIAARNPSTQAAVDAFLNPQPVPFTAADAWEAGRAARMATYDSWSKFAKTGAARGFTATKADADQFRSVER